MKVVGDKEGAYTCGFLCHLTTQCVAHGAYSGQSVLDFGVGDQNVAASKHGALEEDFAHWKHSLLTAVKDRQPSLVDGELPSADEESESESEEGGAGSGGENLADVEDLGGMMGKLQASKKVRQQEEEVAADPKQAREMITPQLRKVGGFTNKAVTMARIRRQNKGCAEGCCCCVFLLVVVVAFIFFW